MQPYSQFRPTGFDPAGAFLWNEQRNWLVAPVTQTRDSDALDRSNFRVAVRELHTANCGDDWQIHRFGHWGPGWFEIILVRPDSLAAKLAAEWESSLSDYPILSEEDHSELEWEGACEAWTMLSTRERIAILSRHKLNIFAARRDEIPQGLPYFDDFYRGE